MRCRAVILLELTVPAEEGLDAAKLRKEAKYTKLLESISESNYWKPQLLTLEVGARGLVSTRAYRAFTILGFTAVEAKKLCKSVSEVAARCSFAIFLAHKQKTWIRSQCGPLCNKKRRRTFCDTSVDEAESARKQARKC
jgi:hypothetical protein